MNMSDEHKQKVIEQAWWLCECWMDDPFSEGTSKVQNGLFELLKESDPDWPKRFKNS